MNALSSIDITTTTYYPAAYALFCFSPPLALNYMETTYTLAHITAIPSQNCFLEILRTLHISDVSLYLLYIHLFYDS